MPGRHVLYGIAKKFVPMPLPTFVERAKNVASIKPSGVKVVLPSVMESGEAERLFHAGSRRSADAPIH